MCEIKKSACDKAYELIHILSQINDEEFVDSIIDCIKYNDNYALSDLREGKYIFITEIEKTESYKKR